MEILVGQDSIRGLWNFGTFMVKCGKGVSALDPSG